VELDERTLRSVAAYDQHAAAYQQSLRLKRPVADVRRFADRARRDDLVLDVGCGPASDLRLLRDAGVHPVGVDLALGALREARMLLPRHPLVQAPFHALPFGPGSFQGLWLSGTFNHLPRRQWQGLFAELLRLVDRGPVYLACYRGAADLEPLHDPVLGEVFVSAASEQEIESLFAANGLSEVTIELRPDPVHDRRRPWVVALGTRSG
jgi:SAM-dependent methyltransferase